MSNYKEKIERKIRIVATKRLQEDEYEPLEISVEEEVTIKCTPEEADGIRLEMFDIAFDNLKVAFKERGIKYE